MPCDTIRPLAVGGSIDQGFYRVLGPLRRPSWGSQRVGASDPEHSPMTGSKSERRIGRPIGCSRGDAPPFPSRTAHNVRGSLSLRVEPEFRARNQRLQFSDADQFVRPLLHDGSAKFDKVASLVGLFDHASGFVHEGLFGQIAGDAVFRRPVAEGRSEAVNRPVEVGVHSFHALVGRARPHWASWIGGHGKNELSVSRHGLKQGFNLL